MVTRSDIPREMIAGQGWHQRNAAGATADAGPRPWEFNVRPLQRAGIGVGSVERESGLLETQLSTRAAGVPAETGRPLVGREPASYAATSVHTASHRAGGRGARELASIDVDAEGRISSVSRSAELMLGWTDSDLAGKPLLSLTGARNGRALAHGSMLLDSVRLGRRLRLDDAEFICKDRSLLPVTCTATPRPAGETPMGVTLSFQPATDESARTEPAARPTASIPLLDQAAFEACLARATRTANRDLSPLAVLVLRLEQRQGEGSVQRLNEPGWESAAARLRGLLRPGDSVARVGADQIAVLQPGLDSASASRTAWAVVTALGQPSAQGGPTPVINAGLALYPRDSGDTLLLNAEAALSAARHRGSGVAIYGSRVPDPAAVIAGLQA